MNGAGGVASPGAQAPEPGDGEPDVDRDRLDALYAPLRPRRGRRVGYAAAAGILLVLGGPAVFVARTGPGAWTWVDRSGIIAVALLIAWGLTRLAGVSAVPGPSGLRVRNLLLTRELEWTQIVAVRFGGGGPWVVLDLSDGDVLAVMAVQRADGAFGQAEARRLATLVALHSRTSRND